MKNNLNHTPIYTDKYGRIKVQFAWDTHSKEDENSFAWVRMKQAWGSDQFGMHFTPRVGQEVVVSFDKGDPNQPIVIGVLPSIKNPPPFTPGTTPSQLGFQSLSLSPDATQQAIPGNRVMFDDAPATAGIALHAYKDFSIETTRDHTLNVGGTTTINIAKGSYVHRTGGKLTINAKEAIHFVNGTSRISITPSDIIIEADKIVMGAPQGEAATTNASTIQPLTSAAMPATSTPLKQDNQALLCNPTPTPAPQSVLGKCSYYQFRQDDFIKRHAKCGGIHTPPSYYLDYGLKYCEKFTTELYPKMSPDGKTWLIKAKRMLQDILEKGLQAAGGGMSENYTDKHHPIANELNNQEFTDYVFHTHVEAYEKAGFENLTPDDVGHLMRTIDIQDDINLDTAETGIPLLGYYVEKNTDRYSAKVMKEICYKVSRVVTMEK